MHVSSSKDNYCTMQCAIACIDKVSDLKMLLDKKWLTWKFKTNSGRTAAEHMLNTASVRTENGGVEFHTHGNRKLRNSFHTYDNRKVCPSFNLFLKSTFSLTLGKNNGTALVVWQPTAGRHKGWQPQGAPAGLGSSHHYMQTTCWHKVWRKINLNIFMLQGPMALSLLNSFVHWEGGIIPVTSCPNKVTFLQVLFHSLGWLLLNCMDELCEEWILWGVVCREKI